MDLYQAAGSLGFPIVAAIYLLVENKRTTDKFITLATQAAIDSQASTEAIKESSKVISSNTTALTNNTTALNQNTEAFRQLKERMNKV
jgi:hypothetical protein